MKQLWYPKASRVQTFDNVYPGMIFPRLDGTILHTTEGVGWPGYQGGASAPNFTVMPDWSAKKAVWRQHFQINRSSRALAGSVNGVSNNRFHINQIEIVGTSGWATTRNPSAKAGRRGTYLLDEKWYVPNYPDWFWKEIGDFLKWQNSEWGVPLVAPMKFVSFNSNNRMSISQWSKFKGIAGHQHVPYNDHNDPGIIPIDKILSFAKGSAPAAPTKPVKKEDPVSAEDVWKKSLPFTVDKTTNRTAGVLLSESARQSTFATREAREAKVLASKAAENTAKILATLDNLNKTVAKLTQNDAPTK